MGRSRRPCSGQHFITVWDGGLQNAQSALKAWAKDMTALHSTLSQTMLFPGSLLVGCQDFNLLDLYGLDNTWARKKSFLEEFRSQPRFFAAARNKPKALELVCKTITLGVDVQCVDSLQQTPLF